METFGAPLDYLGSKLSEHTLGEVLSLLLFERRIKPLWNILAWTRQQALSLSCSLALSLDPTLSEGIVLDTARSPLGGDPPSPHQTGVHPGLSPASRPMLPSLTALLTGIESPRPSPDEPSKLVL